MDEKLLITKQKKRAERACLLVILALGIFLAAVCSPISIWSANDVAVAKTAFPMIWDFVMNLFQILFYWCSFAFLISLSAKYSLNGCINYILGYDICLVVRYFLTLAVSYIMLRESINSGIWSDLFYVLLDIVFDMIQMAVVVFFLWYFTGKNSACKKKTPLYITSFFKFSDPYLCVVGIAALIPALIRLLSRAYYDIFFYGAPTGLADLLWMILYYTLDILCVPIGYLVMLLIINELSLRLQKAEGRLR